MAIMASHSSRIETATSRSSSSANFAPRSSPTRVTFYGHSSSSQPSPSPSSSVRLSTEHRAAMSATKAQRKNAVSSSHKRTCMCSPTSHPGSFRCAYHKRLGGDHQQTASCGSRVNLQRLAMKNCVVVRMGGARRALATLIRPSSHQQCRREAFQPRPSRLSLMSNAEDS